MPARLDPDAAAAFMIAAGLEPLERYPGSTKPWRCRCMQCGSEVTPRHGNIKQGWGACSTCRGRASSLRQRGSEEEAIEAMRAAGLEPLESYRSVMMPWLSQCRTCGKKVSPLLNNIRKGQGGCKWCAQAAVDPEEAAQVMRLAGLEPLIEYPGRHAPWPCRCQKCRHAVSPRYGAVKRGTGCRYCNDTAIKPDEAAEAMKAAGLDPLEPYPGSLQPWNCRCVKCGQVVHPCYSTIQRGGGGCRWCRNSGFKSLEEATVYLISHPSYNAVKVGITDTAGSRLIKHRRRGWQVVLTVKVPGDRAIAIEAEILDWWRGELALPIHLGKQEMPQGGWTETVDVMEIDLAATMFRIKQLAPA